jgi:ABC-type transport system involved in multi-copper enzyme maturation permease subunit
MHSQLVFLTFTNLRLIVRDRILHAVLGVALVLLLLVPVLSAFSMRQMQEVAVTLSLSAISLVLLVVTLLLGTSSVWRDVERRYVASLLSLPLSRATYLLAKFFAIALFLLLCGAILALVTAVVVPYAAAQYPSDLPIARGAILLAIVADLLKYLLLAGFAILLSTVSTSFFLPFFGTLAIYLAGSASQEVYEYVTAEFGQQTGPLAVSLIKGAYYLLPNLAAFNFKAHAVYALPISAEAILLPLAYACSYGALLMGLAIWAFNRRELS